MAHQRACETNSTITKCRGIPISGTAKATVFVENEKVVVTEWRMAPRALIDAAMDEPIALFTCAALNEELAGALPRQSFARRSTEKQLPIPALIER